MLNKTAILDNVEQYTADELVRYIKHGIVTFDELCNETDGRFAASIRKEVRQKLNSSEEAEWTKAKDSGNPDELKSYINVYPNGKHKAEAQQLIQILEEKREQIQVAENMWKTVDKQSASDLCSFLEKYPDTPHCAEAIEITNKLNGNIKKNEALADLIEHIEEISNGERTKGRNGETIGDKNDYISSVIIADVKSNKVDSSDIREVIRKDNNFLNASVVRGLTIGKILSDNDFKTIGIDEDFVKMLKRDIKTKSFDSPAPLTEIKRKSTEIYFWGIPSSGKSCALGGILSTANTGHVATTMNMDANCQGYDYMNKLSELFKKDETGTLPGSTPTTSTYEMGFDLVAKDGKTHPLTCIDLAGELFCCMYKKNAGIPLDQKQKTALDVLNKILDKKNSTKNQKIHFFVLEYGAEKKKYGGLTQGSYLNAAVQYIKKAGIFKNNTDAIYLLITKSDKAGMDNNTLQSYIKEHYMGFYSGLKNICKNNDINKGIVDIIPFSLGKVCFQDYCHFDDRSATEVVKILLEKSYGYEEGRINTFFNILRG